MSHALRMQDVRYRYPDAARPALDGVSLDVEQGELVLVLGESGSGKSTLLRAALGLVPSFHGGELAGRVVSEGLDTREHSPAQMARHVGLVFQDPESQLVMRRADHEVAFGLENLGCDPREILPRAEQALTAVAAGHLAERETGKLSGGEQQRVAIASVLAMGQSTLLLDEPTSQLDPIAAEELLALVTRINRDRGITVVLAEHRTSRIFAEADRVVVMEAGRIVFDGSPAEAAAHLAGSAPWLLPPVTQAFVAAHRPELPLTVRDARRLAAPAPPSRRELSAAATVVALRSVTKRYGEIPALRGATTALRAGTVTALVGPKRRRQVDAGTDRDRSGASRRRPGRGRRRARLRQPEPGTPRRAGAGRRRGRLRPREPGGGRRRNEHGGWRPSWRGSASRSWPVGTRVTCPAGSGSGWRSHR